MPGCSAKTGVVACAALEDAAAPIVEADAAFGTLPAVVTALLVQLLVEGGRARANRRRRSRAAAA